MTSIGEEVAEVVTLASGDSAAVAGVIDDTVSESSPESEGAHEESSAGFWGGFGSMKGTTGAAPGCHRSRL